MLLMTACSIEEFNDLPHSRWVVRGHREGKISGTVVAIREGKECSVTIRNSVKEAEALFRRLIYR